MNRPLIELHDLVKKFPADGGAQVSAVDRVSLSIQAGESVGLVGESGSGKSTLGLLMTRLTPASSGQIIFDNKRCKGDQLFARRYSPMINDQILCP